MGRSLLDAQANLMWSVLDALAGGKKSMFLCAAEEYL